MAAATSGGKRSRNSRTWPPQIAIWAAHRSGPSLPRVGTASWISFSERAQGFPRRGRPRDLARWRQRRGRGDRRDGLRGHRLQNGPQSSEFGVTLDLFGVKRRRPWPDGLAPTARLLGHGPVQRSSGGARSPPLGRGGRRELLPALGQNLPCASTRASLDSGKKLLGELAYKERIPLIQRIEELRKGRKLISICNFDRKTFPPIPGLVETQFHADLKECLFSVLKDAKIESSGVDIFLYTRGGDTNSVWPIVSLIREFDKDFEVLIPFRAHSAGTMLSLASSRIYMTRLAEISPIDPSTGNQFNPIDPNNKNNRLGISVEDLNAYNEFIKESLNFKEKENLIPEDKVIMENFLKTLVSEIHPLAIGNVHRVHKLVQNLAEKLLSYHYDTTKHKEIVNKLTVESYSHLHMINRYEAKDILGDPVSFVDDDLENALDILLKEYEDSFYLRDPLFFSRLMKNELNMDFRFIGGVVESQSKSYLFETKGTISQFSELQPNINIQIPPGQPMPLILGLPRRYSVDIKEQRWINNKEPKGVTL